MSNIYKNFLELIGNTPIVHLSNIEKAYDIEGQLLAKLEYFNPAGSAKDRIALAMIKSAQECGQLKQGGHIVEPTSGNTGIGLAAVCAALGYSITLTMPETMSVERMQILKAYGATLELTKNGMSGAIARAKEIAEATGAFMPSQFTNESNPDVHEKTTAEEILRDTGGKIDIFVAGIGTGGTITGVGRHLKREIAGIKIVGVEPADSAVLSGKPAGPHKIQGTGAGFIPEILDTEIYDEIFQIEAEQAYEMGRAIAQKEGYLVGISSGAALYAAMSILKHPENKGKTVLAFLPDGGERYLSTDLFKL